MIYNAPKMPKVLEKQSTSPGFEAHKLNNLAVVSARGDIYEAIALSVQLLQINPKLQGKVRETLGEKLNLVLLFVFQARRFEGMGEQIRLLKRINQDYPEAMEYIRGFLNAELAVRKKLMKWWEEPYFDAKFVLYCADVLQSLGKKTMSFDENNE